MIMKDQAPKLKVRINKKLNDVDLSKIKPEKYKDSAEFLKNIKLPK